MFPKYLLMFEMYISTIFQKQNKEPKTLASSHSNFF